MRLTLFVDHACNLRCTYCYNGHKFAAPMPVGLARDAVDLVLGMGRGLRQVGFFGGEPLLRFELVRKDAAYVRERTAGCPVPPALVVTTNGTLLDDARVAWLAAERCFVGVSLDGVAGAHDACRVTAEGRGSHEAVVAGVRRALAAGIRLKTISVVDPAAVDRLAESFDHLLELGVRQMSFNINYQASWDDEARDRFQAALDALVDRYVAAYRRGVDFRLNILDAKVVTHLKSGYSGADRCDFGCEELAVAPSGRIYPCDRLVGRDDRAEVVIGTVAAGIDEARRDALIAAKNAVLDECTSCAIADRCMHWCGCVNHAMTGSVGEVSGLLCWFEQRLVQAADRAAGALFAERCPGFLRRFYRPFRVV